MPKSLPDNLRDDEMPRGFNAIAVAGSPEAIYGGGGLLSCRGAPSLIFGACQKNSEKSDILEIFAGETVSNHIGRIVTARLER